MPKPQTATAISQIFIAHLLSNFSNIRLHFVKPNSQCTYSDMPSRLLISTFNSTIGGRVHTNDYNPLPKMIICTYAANIGNGKRGQGQPNDP
ncbi:hypothetical protein D918_06391 [Trichuris suis]|nr:hypothetical protein D918_06391 [Trichuris suis]